MLARSRSARGSKVPNGLTFLRLLHRRAGPYEQGEASPPFGRPFGQNYSLETLVRDHPSALHFCWVPGEEDNGRLPHPSSGSNESISSALAQLVHGEVQGADGLGTCWSALVSPGQLDREISARGQMLQVD